MSWMIFISLVFTGLVVGFINTLAGGGTIISLTLLMMLGLPPAVANGTNRLAVMFQVLTSSASFKNQKILDLRKGILLGIPTVIGSLLGAWVAIDIDGKLWEKLVTYALIIMLVFILIKPSRWLRGSIIVQQKKISWFQYLIFLLIGFYGGLIHVGVGYFILAAVVLGAGYDLVKANALKVFIVLLYIPFTLSIFMINGMVDYRYGLTHAMGNVAGAWIASRFAVNWGVDFVRWILVLVILVFALNSFGFIDIKEGIHQILSLSK